jgi:membrane peptidoglycan carboxypeptidase
MASFDGDPRSRRSAWPSESGAGELDDGYDDPHGFGDPDRAHAAPPSPKRRSFLWRWRRIFFLFGLMAMTVPAGVITVMARTELPEIDDLQQSSFVCTAEVTENCGTGNGDVGNNAMAQLSGDEARVNVSLDDVPQVLIDAVIAAEDRSFYEHTGIDPVGITRALYQAVRAGGLEQGGSTITQQFVKNTYLTHEQTMSRKLEEALLAIRVEQEMSKDQILEGYLNTIYLGRNAYGIQAASQAYFGKPVQEVGLAEATLLAGLIRAPELADPERNPEEAARRQRTVLDAMLEEGYISQQEYNFVEAVDIGPGFIIPRQDYRQTRMLWAEAESKGMQYVTDYVRQETERILQEELGWGEEQAGRVITSGGLRIYTTIDRTLQTQAYDAVYTNTLNQAGDPAGALVAVNNQGHVQAMVGGRADQGEQTNYVNYATAERPVGSTFKPIALAEAVARNYSMEGSQLNAPGETTIEPGDLPCEPWNVSNYDDEDAPGGTFNLIEATQYSSNTAYGQLMKELGPENVKNMAQSLGMDSELSDCLPTVLGADNSTPLEMAEVYSTFMNSGVHKEPTIITRIEQVDQEGRVEELYRWQPHEQRVLSDPQAQLVTHALRQVVEGGTGEAANFGKQVAGKTGTTQSNRDAWFVGYTPTLTASVWMGHPVANWLNQECLTELDQTQGPTTDPAVVEERRTQCTQVPPMNSDGVPVHGLQSITGGSLPAEIFRKFMEQATQNRNDTFVEPTPEMLRQGQELGGDGGYNDGTETTTTTATPPSTNATVPPPTDTEPTMTLPEDPNDPGPTTSTSEPDDSTTTTGMTIFPPPTDQRGREDD